MKICVLVPVYNEARAIAKVVRSVKESGKDVFVVDDGSTDGCGNIAKEAGAEVLTNPQRMGKGGSLRLGFKYVCAQGYDGVITIDGDGQHAIEDIASFEQLASELKADVIVGNRMHDSRDMPLVRFWTNQFMSWMISLACGVKIPDTQCGFRFIRSDALRQLDLVSSGFEIETEILMKAARQKLTIKSVSIQTIYADEKSHIHPLRDGIRFFVYFFRELIR